MMYFMFLFGFCFVFWMAGVASNSSPYYGVVSLIFGAFSGCGVLVSVGGSFVSLLLFLIYLGGMLVIFAYSSALAVEFLPAGEETSLDRTLYGAYYFLMVVGLVVAGFILWNFDGVGSKTVDCDGVYTVRFDFSGLSWLYCTGSGLLLASGWGLMLTLFVVLELVRGLSRGVLRAI
nr:NADH dehydrogenase subunit 6 [Geoclemys hamiltonii]